MALEIVDGQEDQPPKGSSGKTVFEIVVDGKRETFDFANPEQAEELRRRAQMGTKASQKIEALNQKELERQRQYKPYMEFDQALKSDPDLAALVTARLRGDPLPLERFGVRPKAASNGAGDDPEGDDQGPSVTEMEARLRRDQNTKFDRFGSVLERIETRMNQRDMQDMERTDEARIKAHPIFKGWVRDDHVTLAKEAMRQRGGSLYDNFVLLHEQEIPKILSSRYDSSIPPELRRTMLNRDTAPLVIDGQTLTEESLAAIRKDPDLYMKYKKQLRAWKQQKTGKIPYPR